MLGKSVCHAVDHSGVIHLHHRLSLNQSPQSCRVITLFQELFGTGVIASHLHHFIVFHRKKLNLVWNIPPGKKRRLSILFPSLHKISIDRVSPRAVKDSSPVSGLHYRNRPAMCRVLQNEKKNYITRIIDSLN